MTGTLRPRDAKELRQAVEWALNDGVTLDVRGGGSKLALGRPMTCDQVLGLAGLSGIVDYAPEELVITLRAGTPLREVEALLAQRNQMLAFEPPDLGPLLGRAAGEGTLVGAVMGNFAGPRRLSAGAAHVRGTTALRVEGVAPSVQARLKGLRELLADSAAAMEELGTLESRTFWREVRDAAPLDAAADWIVWRVSCPPSEGPTIVSRIRTHQPSLKVLYDWSGGLIWLALPPSPDADHLAVRGAIGATGGHATLIRAPEA